MTTREVIVMLGVVALLGLAAWLSVKTEREGQMREVTWAHTDGTINGNVHLTRDCKKTLCGTFFPGDPDAVYDVPPGLTRCVKCARRNPQGWTRSLKR